MTITAQGSNVYAAPGTEGSLISFKPRYGNFIGGQWVEPADGQYMENISPVDGKVFCEVPRSKAADVEKALDAAHAAAPAWGRTSVQERSPHPAEDRRRPRGEPRDARRRRDLGQRQAGP
jgi:aldehyde dehydrogenase